MSKITIGCRLPSGLKLEVNGVTVGLAGQRQAQERSPIITLSADDYGVTEVDTSFWEAFKARVGKDFAPIKSGAVFEAKNTNDIKAKAKDLKGEKTGFEAMDKETKEVKTEGND